MTKRTVAHGAGLIGMLLTGAISAAWGGVRWGTTLAVDQFNKSYAHADDVQRWRDSVQRRAIRDSTSNADWQRSVMEELRSMSIQQARLLEKLDAVRDCQLSTSHCK
jgi:hypothetical protein